MDNYIWRYVLDLDAGKTLAQAARQSQVDVVVVPAVVHEVLRAGNRGVRRRLCELLTRKCWHRLMPEAYNEALDLLGEIKRVRPEWLEPDPDLTAFRRLERDWMTRAPDGHWSRIRRNPDGESATLDRLADGTVAEASWQALGLRLASQEARLNWDSFKLEDRWYVDAWLMGSQDHVERFEAWRVDSANWYARQLFEVRFMPNPTLDWMGPHLRHNWSPSSQEWKSFWHDVGAEGLPREVIRWATRTLQSLRKTNSGTVIDNQIASYLPDCDVIATADRTFVDVLERVRQYVPCRTARPVQLPGGDGAFSALCELIASKRLPGNQA
ncbi:MAG: hypothetical protein AB1486_03060 [Planctomycetota bacterium]